MDKSKFLSLTRYLWGQAVDQLFAQETIDDGEPEDVLYPVIDNLHSVRSLVEYDGDIAATYSYDTYGNVMALVGSVTDSRFFYTCQEYDLSTDLYYYNARWYDSAIGKFVSEDPTGIATGDANFYRYVGNDPIDYTDAAGLEKTVTTTTYTWEKKTTIKLKDLPDKFADFFSKGINDAVAKATPKYIKLNENPPVTKGTADCPAGSIKLDTIRISHSPVSTIEKALKFRCVVIEKYDPKKNKFVMTPQIVDSNWKPDNQTLNKDFTITVNIMKTVTKDVYVARCLKLLPFCIFQGN